MIPKIIHYCWFGENPKPDDVKKYIDGWRKICPDYQIIEWNEKNFDIKSSVLYVREAYESKKWAFVSDFVRLYALYEYGGIYFDTDIELIKNIDSFLDNDSFIGYETTGVAAGVIGAQKRNPIIGELLKEYDERPFLLENGEMNLKPNPEYFTEYLEKFGFQRENKFQMIRNMKVYPSDIFYPYNPKTLRIIVKPETITIHHYSGSWLPEEVKYQLYIRKKIGKYLPYRISIWIAVLYAQWKYYGLKEMCSSIIKRLRKEIKK